MHYMVVSPEMARVEPVLDDGSGPSEYFRCAVFVDAPRRSAAKSAALKLPGMAEWLRYARSDSANPFGGLVVTLPVCEHGKCWCDVCVALCGGETCEICGVDEAERKADGDLAFDPKGGELPAALGIPHEFIATFGASQPNAGGYVVVTAPDRSAATAAMNAVYGQKWSMIYDSPEEAGVQRWGLRLIGRIDARTEGACYE